MTFKLALLLAFVLLAPAAAAQGGDPLSEENNTLWNQYTNDPSCCESWMSTDKDDPAFSGNGNLGTSTSTADGSYTWELPLEPRLNETLFLDPEGTIDVTVHIGSATNVGTSPYLGAGDVTVTVVLYHGEDIVAEGDDDLSYITTTVGDYEQASWSLTPEKTTLAPEGGNLVWEVTVSGMYSGTFMSYVDSTGNGWLTLPIIGVSSGVVEPATLYEPLDTPSVELELDGPSSDTYIYNLTSDLEEGRLSISGNGTGNLSVTLKDAENTTLIEETLEGDFSEAFTFQGAVAGDWQLTLALDDYNGTVQAGIEALPADGEVPEDGSTPEDGTDDNSSTGPAGNETVEDDEGFIPAPGLVPVMVLLVSAVAALRARGARR